MRTNTLEISYDAAETRSPIAERIFLSLVSVAIVGALVLSLVS